MEHIAVESSNIASIAHDPGSQIMQVLFRRGGLYEYPEVSADEFEQVLNPSSEHEGSVTKAFTKVIKERKSYKKLESATAAPPTIEAPARDQEAPAPAAPLPEEVQVVSRKSTELTAQATAIVVRDPATQTQASEMLVTVAAMRTEIATTFRPMKEAAFGAHRIICDQERQLDAPLLAAETALKRQIGSYVQEQQRIAREEEDRLRREAQAAADAEAKRLSEEQALLQAQELSDRGFEKEAEAVLENPAPVPVPYVAPAPVAPAVAQTQGVTTRMEWDFRIVDHDKIPREYMVVNEAAIRQVVKSTRGKIRIPGVEAFEKPVVATSRRG